MFTPEGRTSMKFVLVDNTGDGLTHVHREGCRDLARQGVARQMTIEAEDVDAAIEKDLSESGLRDQGFDEGMYHVLPCAE